MVPIVNNRSQECKEQSGESGERGDEVNLGFIISYLQYEATGTGCLSGVVTRGSVDCRL